LSDLHVPVTAIDKILPHANADSLEIAHVLGWQLVVGKGQYQDGDKIVFIPPDTVLPPELSDRLNVTKYLDKGRIRCTRLRGEPSFGLAIMPDDPTWEIGTDVAEYYGLTKWMPPVRRFSRNGIAQPRDESYVQENPFFYRYTSIDNMRHFPDLFDDGEEVIVTEKIHGTNSRVGIIDGEKMAGSHKMQRSPLKEHEEQTYPYWFPWSLQPVQDLLTVLTERGHKQVVLYGEIYGPGVQSLSYGVASNALAYRAFDLLVDGKYLDWDDFEAICMACEVDTVPLLARIPFSLQSIQSMSKGTTTLMQDKAHMREGVVVKPVHERTHPKAGRCILKYVSDEHLLGKKTDFTEE
jgi:RNA ligase (TIGR02306 family)